MSVDKYLEWIKSVNEMSARREELCKQVGRVVIALSEIEYNLAIAFISSEELEKIETSITRFYAKKTFEKKLKLVEGSLARNTWWDGDMEAWYEFRDRLKKHKLIRNMVAHQASGFVEGEPALVPSWLIQDKRGRSLGIKEIKEAADELEALDSMARRLHVLLGANDGVLGGYKPKHAR